MFAKPLNIVQYNMFTSVVCYINYKTDFLFNDVSSLLFKVSWDKHTEKLKNYYVTHGSLYSMIVICVVLPASLP